MADELLKYCCLYRSFSKLEKDTSAGELEELINPCIEGDELLRALPRIDKIRWAIWWFRDVQNNYTEKQCPQLSNSQNSVILTPQVCDLPTESHFKLYIGFWALLLLLIVFGNLLVIVTMLRVRFLRSNIANLFIVSLAVSDFCIGAFIIPIKIGFAKHNMNFCFSKLVCRFYVITDTIFFITSIVNLVVIAFDRYFALTYPSKYQLWMTRKRAKSIIALIWLYGLVIGGLTNVKFDNIHEDPIELQNTNCSMSNNPIYVYILFILHFFLPAIVMGMVYIHIFVLAKRFARSIADSSSYVFKENTKSTRRLEDSKNNNYFAGIIVHQYEEKVSPKLPNFSATTKIDTETSYGSYKMASCKTVTQYKKIILKTSKTVAVVYGTFVTCWLPLCVFAIAVNICKPCFANKVNKLFFIICIEILPILNSMLNIFIYAFMNSKFRRGIFKILRGEN